ncbi:MAG TPA: hypothetical protein PK443_05820, partial [bacterium]|nr:hypothetical protein [bacterium]
LVSFLHKLYNEMYKNPLLKKTAEDRFGKKDDINKNIESSLLDINRILNNEIIIDGNNVQEHLFYYEETIKELNEWLKDL